MTGAAGRRPNVLLVMCDQLAAGWLPFHGHAATHAPHLAALAREGVVFERAYCASPLCGPSRAAMLTGRLPSATGVFDNAAEWPAAMPTVVHALRAAGYATALAGKMHFVGPDQLHGYEERLTTDVYPASFDWTPDWSLPAGVRLPWYHNVESLLMAGVREAAMQTDYDDEVAFHAVRKLRELARARDGRPFFLTVSFTNPHDPWEVRRRHWDLYEHVDVGRPTAGRASDPLSERLRAMCGLDDRPLTAEEKARARRAYLAAISYADERIGEVLAALADCGHAGDTVVVFTADHGELLGEHELWYKMSFLDPSARVPLVLRMPGRAAARVAAPVSHLDLAPTLAELAGADLGGDELHGASLVPVVEGRERPGDVLAEYLAEGVTEPAVMIRRGRHKLVRCGEDPDQLHDLDADPHELANLAGDPAGAALREAVDERWDLAGLRTRVVESQRRRHEVSRALAVGAHTPWDHQPWVDATRRYVRAGAASRDRPGERPLAGELPGEEPD
ncbi:MAG TPA: choline-sulfatase [Gaiellales bacterium]|nr:choline-sulfatase [Gaiellales bacterium]